MGLTVVLKSYEIVEPGERGIVIRLGSVTGEVLDEGFHWKKPFVDEIVRMDVQIQKEEESSSAASSDLQSVTAKIAVNYSLDPSKVTKIYQEFRKDYVSRVIDPSIQESVKSATSKFTAEQLITKREDVRNAIDESIKNKLGVYGINVTQVNIVDFDFSPAFNNAIEAKVTAEQEALREKNNLEKVKFEQQQEIEKFKAQAEKSRLEVEALRQGGDEFIRKLNAEAYLEIAKNWNGVLPTHIYGSAPIPLLGDAQ